MTVAAPLSHVGKGKRVMFARLIQIVRRDKYVAGTFRKQLALASGRFAMIDDGLGFQLVPQCPTRTGRRGAKVDWLSGRGAFPRILWGDIIMWCLVCELSEMKTPPCAKIQFSTGQF